MADLAGTPGKRPRSDSAGSVPESKRPSIQKREEGESSPKIIEEGDVLPEDEESTQDAAANNGDTVMTDAQEGANEPTAATATSSITPAPASAGLPETPVAAAAAAEAAAAASSTEPTEEVKPVPLITMRALIVTQDASIIIGKGLLRSSMCLDCAHKNIFENRRNSYSRDQGQVWLKGRRQRSDPKQPGTHSQRQRAFGCCFQSLRFGREEDQR